MKEVPNIVIRMSGIKLEYNWFDFDHQSNLAFICGPNQEGVRDLTIFIVSSKLAVNY